MQRHGKNGPSEIENLDELAIPPPVEEHNQTSWPSTTERPNTDPHHDPNVQHDSEADEYDPSYEFENLDELKAPSPVQNPQSERLQGYLEDRQHSISARSEPVQGPTSPERSRRDGQPVPKHEAPASSWPSHLSRGTKSSPRVRHGQASRFATELYTISHLIFFSILGTLARLGLQALTFYPGAPVQTGVLWPNVAGSLILGFLLEDRKLFNTGSVHLSSSPTPVLPPNPHNDEERTRPAPPSSAQLKLQYTTPKKAVPLYIGLSAGFCGSLTSFSSFIRDAFLALANALPTPISHTSPAPIDPASTVPRNGGYSFMALLAVLITTVALCLSALIAGAHLAIATQEYTPSIPADRFARKLIDRGIVFLAWASWLGAIVMAIWPPDRADGGGGGPAYHGGPEHWRGKAVFAIVFAPLGCLLRFYVSVHLNSSKIAPSFPLGTFAINVLGTALEGVFYDLQHLE
ncbi:MAG: hypothetical protein Q9216_007130, partial [Gyalolechia sp. 2 TL-2023]